MGTTAGHRKRKSGFTFVELVVILVILAALAAILVPTLLGYIAKAKSSKDYQAAQAYYIALTSATDEAKSGKIANDDAAILQKAKTLSEVDTSKVTASFAYSDTTFTVSNVKITIVDSGGTPHVYTRSDTDGAWSVAS